MANGTVTPQLADNFEVALKAYAISVIGADGYHPFVVGYLFSMLKRGDYNEHMVGWHMMKFAANS